ncbi:MAG: caspase family protein [Myxococcales bacterium]
MRPRESIQTVYQAIVLGHLSGSSPAPEAFLAEAMRLCEHVAKKVEGGARLLDDDLFAGEAAFERYLAMLASDQVLWREDLSRGTACWAEIPAERDASRSARKLPLLVLRSPVSAQFKVWARREASAPGGRGFPLLLTRTGEATVVLSADPGARLEVGWLAQALSAAEKDARGGVEAPWYDGERFKGTLCASPLEGTRLELDAVVKVLRRELKLSPAKGGRGRQALAGVAIAAAVAVLVVGGAVMVPQISKPGAQPNRPVEPAAVTTRNPGAKASKGAERECGPVCNYALVMGVGENARFSGGSLGQTPIKDTIEIARLLHDRFGFVMPFASKDQDGKPTYALLNPTRDDVIKALYAFTLDQPLELRPNDRLLIYFAGHGKTIPGATPGETKSYWLPADAGDSPEKWVSAADLNNMIDAMSKAFSVIVVSDSCFSGGMAFRGDSSKEIEAAVARQHVSRVYLSSGTDKEEVANSSAFSGAVMGWLQTEKEPFTAFRMYQSLKDQVLAQLHQTPLYEEKKKQGGDFVFEPLEGK